MGNRQKLERKRKFAAILAGFLALLMIGSTLMSGLSLAFAVTKEELNDQLDDIEARKQEAQAQVDAYDGEINAYAEKMSALDYQITITMQDIDLTEQMIAQLDEELLIKEDEIELATQKVAEKEELFATRVRVMYEAGESSYLDVLLSSNSFSDMLSNIEIITQIMKFDTQVMEDYEAAKVKLEQLKLELEDSKAATEVAKVALEEKQDALEEQQVEYQAVITQLEADKALEKAEMERMEADKAAINAEIERISAAEAAAAKAKAEAEAKAKAEAEAAGQSYTSAPAFNGTLYWPMPVYTRISSYFGPRESPTAGASTIHKGVDLAAPTGNTVVAAAAGTVVKSYFSSSYGNYIVISHGNGLLTGYAHMSVRSVQQGDTVVAEQKIGECGSTGISTGSHLHFEVYENGTAVDPMKFF